MRLPAEGGLRCLGCLLDVLSDRDPSEAIWQICTLPANTRFIPVSDVPAVRVLYCWETGSLDTRDYRTNPYGALLSQALQARGHQVKGEPYYKLRFCGLLINSTADVLHVNHIYHYYKHPWAIISLLRVARLFLWLLLARLLGMKIVWTLHNLYPHETRSQKIDRWCRLLLCRMACTVIVHCRFARDQLAEEFGRVQRVWVVPHGNYIEAYPPAVSKSEARFALGMDPDSHVSLYFGNVRAYKGIAALVRSFSQADLPDAKLVVAGKMWADNFSLDARQVHSGLPEGCVTTWLKPSSDPFTGEEIRNLMSAADMVVLPFRQVLSSGSVMLALSYGKPVVCPRLGCLGELLEDCEGAVLYEPGSQDGLTKALQVGRSLDLQLASRAALERALQMNWSSIASSTERAYIGT